MTFDCESELDKIAEACPAARCVLRIRADDPSAIVQFGHKYGADPAREAPALLATAARLGLEVTGVSFHVGSGSLTPGTFLTAIAAARGVCDAGRAAGFDMALLDIGGGFWGRFGAGGAVQLDAVAAAVNAGLARYFPPSYGAEVIAEPGRYYAEACGTMHALVHTVKVRLRVCPASLAVSRGEGPLRARTGSLLALQQTCVLQRCWRTPACKCAASAGCGHQVGVAAAGRVRAGPASLGLL